jgi:hypothetical protein
MTLRVPYISDETIERDAEALLAQYARAKNVEIKAPIPIEDVVEKHLKLRVEFDDLHRLLGVPRGGSGLEPDIFGAIWLETGEIVIDESLDPEELPSLEGRCRSTLAHEGGGHWRLHRGLVLANHSQACLFGDAPQPTVVWRSSQAKERVEWQADFYASCLLMPRKLVFEAWHKAFGTHNPVIYEQAKHLPEACRPYWKGLRHIGEIIRELWEPEHDYLFDRIAGRFAPAFGVSKQAMRIRLETLGLLLRDVPNRKSLIMG